MKKNEKFDLLVGFFLILISAYLCFSVISAVKAREIHSPPFFYAPGNLLFKVYGYSSFLLAILPLTVGILLLSNLWKKHWCFYCVGALFPFFTAVGGEKFYRFITSGPGDPIAILKLISIFLIVAILSVIEFLAISILIENFDINKRTMSKIQKNIVPKEDPKPRVTAVPKAPERTVMVENPNQGNTVSSNFTNYTVRAVSTAGITQGGNRDFDASIPEVSWDSIPAEIPQSEFDEEVAAAAEKTVNFAALGKEQEEIRDSDETMDRLYDDEDSQLTVKNIYNQDLDIFRVEEDDEEIFAENAAFEDLTAKEFVKEEVAVTSKEINDGEMSINDIYSHGYNLNKEEKLPSGGESYLSKEEPEAAPKESLGEKPVAETYADTTDVQADFSEDSELNINDIYARKYNIGDGEKFPDTESHGESASASFENSEENQREYVVESNLDDVSDERFDPFDISDDDDSQVVQFNLRRRDDEGRKGGIHFSVVDEGLSSQENFLDDAKFENGGDDVNELTSDEESSFLNNPFGENKPRRKKQPYRVPTEGLLAEYSDDEYWVIDEETEQAGAILKSTLNEFKIEAEVTGISKGPVVTMFEILPAPGVKLNKIVALQDNIALRLAASSVRIVAPIPGKHAVGIEVPNKHRSIVSFRELIENDTQAFNKMELPIALGKDISGEARMFDLTGTPHLLIAGSTGAGKSVCVNTLILSLLFKRSPRDVKFILIDPKIVELKLYNDIPHLLTPVITEPKRAYQALQYCLCEMERRYALLDNLGGVRDIRTFNRRIEEQNLAQEKLPYIVVVIDEFADLMATTGKELESTVARLAAMSRAVGIHLVLATQRPSVDVITGLIKTNIPTRIAFMVASKTDSRIILDQMGAEKLLGKGDMLYSSATEPFPVRVQGAFVGEDEVVNVVDFVKTLGEPEYIDDEIFVEEEDDDIGASIFDGDEDPMYDKALQVVMQAGKASASYIQRKLKIGYNRAARLVEEMEARGIVGPANGSKPREIIHMP